MAWLAQNWVWVLFFAGFIAMHMFGHGGHGGHGAHGGGENDPKPASEGEERRTSERGSGHQH